MISRNLTWAAIFTLTGLAVVGCKSLDMPKLPMITTTPKATVQSVNVIEASDEAARVEIILTLKNPNQDPLPLILANYNLNVDGAKSSSNETKVNATLPGDGEISITLTAVVIGNTDAIGQASYKVSGWIEYIPPGKVRSLLNDFGVPQPSIHFSGKGKIGIPTNQASQKD